MGPASGPSLRHFLDLDRIERTTLRRIIDEGCRFKQTPPFDKGAKAEPAGFTRVGVPRERLQHEPDPPRLQGIVDPPSRVLPYRPEAASARLAWAAKMGPPAESWDYVEVSARCAPTPPWQAGAIQIFQRPGEVALLFEQRQLLLAAFDFILQLRQRRGIFLARLYVLEDPARAGLVLREGGDEVFAPTEAMERQPGI